jgi:hypothetical protein
LQTYCAVGVRFHCTVSFRSHPCIKQKDGPATSVTICAFDQDDKMFSSVFALKKGENKFTVTASDDQLITSVNFIATGGIVEDVRQVRIDGIKSIPASDPTITAVPEPSTWASWALRGRIP